MSLAIDKLRVYVKLILIVIIGAMVMAVVVKNRHNTVTIWCFRTYSDINVLWLMLCTAAGSVVGWVVLRATVNVFRDMRQLKRQEDLLNQQRRQEELAKELAEHQQRLKQEPPPAGR